MITSKKKSLQVYDAETSLMLSYGSGKDDESFLVFEPTLSYHCHLQTCV